MNVRALFQRSVHPDPLTHLSSKGVSLGGIDPETVRPEVEDAFTKGVKLPNAVQEGGTCGEYAFQRETEYFWGQDSKNASPLVQPSDLTRADSHTLAPNDTRYILDLSKADGFTTQGEQFDAGQLAELIRQFGYNARVITPLTLDAIKACLAQKHSPMIAFDVDMKGNVGLYNGARAHWCNIEGAFNKDGVDYLVATHAWPFRTGAWDEQTYVWRAEDLIQSSGQLHRADPAFPNAPKDLQGTLANRLIEMWPGASNPAANAGQRPGA